MREKITIAGVNIQPGERKRIDLPIGRLPSEALLSMPLTVVNGRQDGPRLWVSAAIHGDEVNGVEIIHQVLNRLKGRPMAGMLIAVPVVNVFGFTHQSRYLPDRRDLNRSFPGSARGSLASRIAHLFMTKVVKRCSHGIDLHTGSNHRANFPQIRANLDDAETNRCARAFGASVIIHTATRDGSLRQAAAKAGIPILLYEAGEALRFHQDAITTGVEGVLNVMAQLKMISRSRALPIPEALAYSETKWLRARRSGLLYLQTSLGERVKKGQVLGKISDVLGKFTGLIHSPYDGQVIGQTNNPLIYQGDGFMHLAIKMRDSGSADAG